MPTSASSSPLLPTLPLEIHHEILRLCDPSTLAQTSRVSLASLELSSPLLYHHIDFHGSEQFERMLCTRDSTSQPQISSFLSLDQIKTLTFTEPRFIIPSPIYPLHLDRFSTPATPLSLARLSIFLPFNLFSETHPSDGHLPALHFVIIDILAIFHPVELYIEGILPPPADQARLELLEQDENANPNYPPRPFPPNLPLSRQIAENTNLRCLKLKNAVASFKQTRCTGRSIDLELTEGLTPNQRYRVTREIWNAMFRGYVLEQGGEGRLDVAIHVGSEEMKRVMLECFRERVGRVRTEGVPLDVMVAKRWLRRIEGDVKV